MENKKIKQKLFREERELHIWIDEVDRVWKAETSIQKYINRFKKTGWITTSETYYEDGSVCSATFESPAVSRGISIIKPIRNITEEQRRALAERMKAIRENNS